MAAANEVAPPSRKRSRAKSRLNVGDETNDFADAISKIIFLDTRKPDFGQANIISCGGNGIFRAWNTQNGFLIAEAVGHQGASSITMCVGIEERYLVTGDTEGCIKVWDIENWAMTSPKEEKSEIILPPLVCQITEAHADMISTLEVMERNQRQIIISSSYDCCCKVHDFNGILLGTFGQNDHWKIEKYVAGEVKAESEAASEVLEEEENEPQENVEEQVERDFRVEEIDEKSYSSYKMNAWNSTILGKDYQELRSHKRERQQPGTIDLPYAKIETQMPTKGPYASIDIVEIPQPLMLQKPESVYDVANWQSREDRERNAKLDKLPQEKFADLKCRFDDKTLFGEKNKNILENEIRIKQHQKLMLQRDTEAAQTTKHQNHMSVHKAQGGSRAALAPSKADNSRGSLMSRGSQHSVKQH